MQLRSEEGRLCLTESTIFVCVLTVGNMDLLLLVFVTLSIHFEHATTLESRCSMQETTQEDDSNRDHDAAGTGNGQGPGFSGCSIANHAGRTLQEA